MIVTSEFKLFAEICKSLKSPHIAVMNGELYALSEGGGAVFRHCSTNPLAEMFENGNVIELERVVGMLNQHKITKADIVFIGVNGTLSCGELKMSILACDMMRFVGALAELADTRDRVCVSSNNSPICSMVDLRAEPRFETAIKGKAADGATMITVCGYPITVFSSLLNVNMADEAYISLYHYIHETILAVFEVRKKKYSVYTCIRYMIPQR